MVIGCARAVRAAGSHARLIGVGGSKLAVASNKAGVVDGTVCFKPAALGALAFEALHTPHAGPRFPTHPIPHVTRTPLDACAGQWCRSASTGCPQPSPPARAHSWETDKHE